MNKLKQIGYIEKNKQGNRVYNDNCSITISAVGGGLSGHSGFHLINTKQLKNKTGDGKMYKNIMKKLNFNMEEIKLFDSFAGIGALHQSLKELGVPTKLVGVSEVDIDAIISYAAIHIDNFKDIPFDYPSDDEMRKVLMDRNIGYDFKKNKSKIPRLNKNKLKSCFKATILINNLGDIGKLDYSNIPNFDLFNFSFPCQNISIAGKQEGMKKEDGSITNSGLYIYGIEVIKHKKPKYIMIENVKNLIGKKFINDFYKIINQIEDLGYNCYYPTKEDKKGNKKPTCLNAKDFGIPQNRERIFVICIRKDVDTYNFEFPIGKDYGIRLKDILEDEVDEKYYLSDEYLERFKDSLNNKELQHKLPKTGAYEVIGTTVNPEAKGTNSRHWVYSTDKLISTIDATTYKQPKQILDTNAINQIGTLDIKGSEQIRRIYSQEGISPTLTTMQGGNTQPKILDINKLSEDGKTICEQRSDEGLRFFKNNICGTIRTIDAGGDKRVIENLRIRKLTPTECWRLMGFRDEHINKAMELGISDSQLYKQAGNSIVVNVLYCIFKNLFKDYIK